MTASSKCRPRNSAGRFWLTESPYQVAGPELQQSPTVCYAIKKIEILRNFHPQVEELIDLPEGPHRIGGADNRAVPFRRVFLWTCEQVTNLREPKPELAATRQEKSG